MSENIIGYIDDQGTILDTQTAGENCAETPIEYDNSEASLEIVRHSTAHLMLKPLQSFTQTHNFLLVQW